MSLTSQLIEIGFAGLPQAVTSQLQEIGRMDKITRNLTIQLNKEENKLLDTLKLIAKNDPSFDEEPLKKAAASISQRRLLVSQMIEEQMKALQSIYVYLDRKIAYFDSNIKIHAPQLQTENDVSEDQQRKRKKKKVLTTEDEESSVIVLETEKFEEAIALAPVDPNEPLYCCCKRISFGNMIACENPECSIEWYHFSCVGLTSDQSPEMWLCPQCKTVPNGTNETDAAVAVVETIGEGVTVTRK